MMTKRNFISAAQLVASGRFSGKYSAKVAKGLEDTFVEFFRNDNPRFNEDRFRAACNV
jgi:hypothetical protein